MLEFFFLVFLDFSFSGIMRADSGCCEGEGSCWRGWNGKAVEFSSDDKLEETVIVGVVAASEEEDISSEETVVVGGGRDPVNRFMEVGIDVETGVEAGVGTDIEADVEVLGAFRVGLLRTAILLRGADESGA